MDEISVTYIRATDLYIKWKVFIMKQICMASIVTNHSTATNFTDLADQTTCTHAISQYCGVQENTCTNNLPQFYYKVNSLCIIAIGRICSPYIMQHYTAYIACNLLRSMSASTYP